MKVMVLGVGLQGKAVLHDLERSPLISEILAADVEHAAVLRHVEKMGYEKIRVASVDVTDSDDLLRLFNAFSPHAVVCMLPVHLAFRVAEKAVEQGVHYVSSNYTGDLVRLHERAVDRGVTILPEMGMDPGIDLLLCRTAIDEMEEVHGLHSYGGGLPEPACADDNPLHYKITWTFDGVLKAYKRPARLLKNGRQVEIPGGSIFRPEHVHTVVVPDLGELEAYPNGDAVRYIDIYGLGERLQGMGRFTLRWPGHCAIWNVLAELGFLDDDPIDINSCSVSPHRFLVHHLEPRLLFREHERDIAILLAMAWGIRQDRRCRLSNLLIDYRDLSTGLFAMNRTVGYTASIGAQLILSGHIAKKGVLSPVQDVPPQLVLDELKARGMKIIRKLEWLEDDQRPY